MVSWGEVIRGIPDRGATEPQSGGAAGKCRFSQRECPASFWGVRGDETGRAFRENCGAFWT